MKDECNTVIIGSVLLGFAQFVLLALRLFGIITWSWFLVLIPSMISTVSLSVLLILMILFGDD